MVHYFLFVTSNNILSLAFSFKKALKDILQHSKFVNSWFRFVDVTNKLMAAEYGCSSFSDISCILILAKLYTTYFMTFTDLQRKFSQNLTSSYLGRKLFVLFCCSVTVIFFSLVFSYLDSFDFLGKYQPAYGKV